MSPHFDLNLEDSKPIILHDTLAPNDASLYIIWLQMLQQFIKYHPMKHWMKFWTFTVTLTLNTELQSFHKTLKFLMYHQTEFGWAKKSAVKKI